MSYNGTYVRLWFLCGLNTPRSSPAYEPPGYEPQTVFEVIAAKVTHFLTRHSDTWWVDKHEGLCNTEIPCLCCIVWYDGIDCCRDRACQLCLAAWRLSVVSKAIRDIVVDIGKSQPRWERFELDLQYAGYKSFTFAWIAPDFGLPDGDDWFWFPGGDNGPWLEDHNINYV